MGNGKRDLFAEYEAQGDMGTLSPSGELRQHLLGVNPNPIPDITEMVLRRAVDPYNSNALVFPYFPTSFTDTEKAIWQDPETPDTFGRVLQYSRNAPRTVSFELFLNDYGMSNKTAQKSIRIRRAEMMITWLKTHMRPPFARVSQQDTDLTPPVMELVPFPTVDEFGRQTSVFRCIIESISINSSMVRGSVSTLSRFEGRGRVQPRLGDRIRAVASVVLKSHDDIRQVGE